jgi:type IV pilus assembly protein PilC
MLQPQTFSYKVRTRRGQVLEGVLVDRSRAAVEKRLLAQGYSVLSIDSPERRSFLERLRQPRGHVPASTMAIFCRQFAIMLSSGLSVIDSLALVSELMRDQRLKRGLEAARESVLAGSSFAAALGARSEVFPPMVIQMVEAGEATGALNEVMERLAIYYERDAEIRAKVKEAMTYPTVVVFVAIFAIIVIVFFVLPTFVDVFRSMEMELPLITRVLIGVSEFFIRWWWLIAVGLLAGLSLLRRWLGSLEGSATKDRLLLRAPLLGPTVSKLVFSRLSRALSLLVRSGVPMVEALRMAQRLVMSVPVSQAVARATRLVEQGCSLTVALSKEPIFPRMFLQMVQVGEETGSVDVTLDHLADFYDREAGYAIKNLTTLIEPVVIIGLTMMVLFLALAVVIPMFQMSTTVPNA